MAEARDAVIGESEGYPSLYHMNQTRPSAEQLHVRREAAVGSPVLSCRLSPGCRTRAAHCGRHKERAGERHDQQV